MNQEIITLLERLKTKSQTARPLAGGVFYLDDETVACPPRVYGDSRYPYCHDGLTLWAYASGYITMSESSFFVFPPASEGKEPFLAFFGGVKQAGTYQQVSITGVAKSRRNEGENRWTIFTPEAAYYIVEQNQVLFAARVFTSAKKDVDFTLYAWNRAPKKQEVYLSSFMDALMMHGTGESEETKWFKSCRLTSNGFTFEGVEDLSREIHLHNKMGIARRVSKQAQIVSTTSRAVFAGGSQAPIEFSEALAQGRFIKDKKITVFSDTAAAGDIVKAGLRSGESFSVDYRLSLLEDKRPEVASIRPGEFDEEIAQLTAADHQLYFGPNSLKMSFFDKEDGQDFSQLNSFIVSLLHQVDYGALAKNSSVSLLGVRDVAQMLEGALLFDASACRSKILEVLSFETEEGRFPRQYSLPKADEDPLSDNRNFIDQGQWMISLLHSYLAVSDDLSLFKEETGFYAIQGFNHLHKSAFRSNIYDHLKRALSYLLNNIDPATGCLKTLYGDWNDAVDGLGVSTDPKQPFGNGVSAMASFHLYKNLLEMADIAKAMNDPLMESQCHEASARLAKAVCEHLIVSQGKEKRILHGWGENQSFYVGSFHDVDGQDRVGAASNAYFVISGLLEQEPAMKPYILEAYARLDSTYGIKTFTPFFDKDAAKVGRIVNLPKGTAENGAVYLHAALFAIKSLFMMNAPMLAYQQLRKALPITHSFLTTSPFVMPNSYIENPDIDVNGESMNDWFTGSSNTLLKLGVHDLFGVQPQVGPILRIKPTSLFLSNDAYLEVTLKGKRIAYEYHNLGGLGREIALNGRPLPLSKDANGLLYAEIDLRAVYGNHISIVITD